MIRLVLALLLLFAPASAQESPWRFARPDYLLELPRDHVAHPDYKIEWWYYTGNLATAEGRRFGYQLTFFRVGVDRQPVNPSRWAVRDLYMAHFAVTDLARGTHRFADRLNRGGVGWAGAATDRYDVWNEGWRATLAPSGTHVLRASEGTMAVTLDLEPGTRVVRQGQNGFSRKGAQEGNASHYYSLTRMPTRGRLTIDGAAHEVTGSSWMDHEFGSSFLEPSQRGWDWFSLQLEDGRDLMVFQIRRTDGTQDPHSSGTMVEPDGTAAHLTARDFRLEPGRFWRSPRSGAAYPIEWALEIPARGVALRVTTPVESQELRTERSTNVTYWEGSVVADGTVGGRPVRGRGYLEMTGYTGAPMSDVLR